MGEMSLVGPRPELRQYVELFRQEYEEILKMRPGITDLASLKYSDEAAILGKAKNPGEEYVRRVLPDKIRLGKEYIRCSSFIFDLTLVFKTLPGCLRTECYRERITPCQSLSKQPNCNL